MDESPVGAGPETSIARGKLGDDKVVQDLRGILLIEVDKSDAVEPGKTLLCTDPEIAVSSLSDRLGGALK
jgi:hypothetical protein